MRDTVWITGAAGFTGRHALRYLAALPDRPRLVAIDLPGRAEPTADITRQLDIADSSLVAMAAEQDRPRWVMHLAGAMPPARPEQLWLGNVAATAGLLVGLAAADCRCRLLSVGSAAEYRPNGTTPIDETCPAGGSGDYGRSKWAQSMLALAGERSGIEAIVVRPFNLIGPGLPAALVVGHICQQLCRAGHEQPVEIGNLQSARDFIDVRDAVDAYWRLLQAGRCGEIYNLASGQAVTVQRIIEILSELIGRPIATRINPVRVRAGDPQTIIGNTDKLSSATGWQPDTPLARSLHDMLVDAGGFNA